MTPFGDRLRSLRDQRRMTLTELGCPAASLPRLPLRARTRPPRVRRAPAWCSRWCGIFGLIWDDADELGRLARLSHPRVTVDTAGLSPPQTALANRLAQTIHRLSPETVAAMHAILDAV